MSELIKKAMAQNGRRSAKSRSKGLTKEEFSQAMRELVARRWAKKKKLSTV